MADRPVGEIIKSITDSAKQLVQDLVELAKSELVPAAKFGGIGAGLGIAALYFLICALSVLYFALGFGLAAAFGWPTWAGFLSVGILLILITAICGGVAFALFKKIKPPTRTIAQANETVTQLKEAAQHAMAAAKAPQIEGKVVDDQKALR